MLKDVPVPTVLQCSAIAGSVSDAHLLWSSGNTSSYLHHDGYHNILAVLDGTKRVLLAAANQSSNLYADEFTVGPGLSPIDPDSVDIEAYPRAAELTSLWEVVLHEGDALYIPQYWWHHVHSESGSRNIALSVWFSPPMLDFETAIKQGARNRDSDRDRDSGSNSHSHSHSDRGGKNTRDGKVVGGDGGLLDEERDVAAFAARYEEMVAANAPATIRCDHGAYSLAAVRAAHAASNEEGEGRGGRGGDGGGKKENEEEGEEEEGPVTGNGNYVESSDSRRIPAQQDGRHADARCDLEISIKPSDKMQLRHPLPDLALHSGMLLPLVGFGTARLGDQTQTVTSAAISAGFQLIDSAADHPGYVEDAVGRAAAAAAAAAGGRGGDRNVVVATKIQPGDFSADRTVAAVERARRRLDPRVTAATRSPSDALRPLDLVLLHAPGCDYDDDDDADGEGSSGGNDGAVEGSDGGGNIGSMGWPPPYGGCADGTAGTWQESWKTLAALKDTGVVRSIGVSNFEVDELRALITLAASDGDAEGGSSGSRGSGGRKTGGNRGSRLLPDVVQNHFDPFHQDVAVRKLAAEHGIAYQAHSLLGTAWQDDCGLAASPVLGDLTVRAIALDHGMSTAQVVLRWALQEGVAALVRSSNPAHMASNLEVFDHILTEQDMQEIRGMDGQPVKGCADVEGEGVLGVAEAGESGSSTDGGGGGGGSGGIDTLPPFEELQQRYTLSDDCLDELCADAWAHCEGFRACKECEEACVIDEAPAPGEERAMDEEYMACSRSCVAKADGSSGGGDHGDADGSGNQNAAAALERLLACAGACLELDYLGAPSA